MDEKIYYPTEISDAPFPEQTNTSTSVDQPTSSGVTTVPATKNNSFPSKKIAVELLSTALNTKSKKVLQEFTLVDQGAFRVGKYENGVSGEVAMTSAGITAKNKSGNTTFTLDGDTGDAVFSGTIQTGTLVSGLVIVGNNRLVFDGEAGRITVNDGINNIIAIGNLDF